MAMSKKALELALEELRKSDRSYLTPRPYQDFMPDRVPTREVVNQRESYSALTPILERGDNATRLQSTQLQNKREKKAFRQAKNEAERAERLYGRLKARQPDRRRRPARTIDLRGFDVGRGIRRSAGGGVIRRRGPGSVSRGGRRNFRGSKRYPGLSPTGRIRLGGGKLVNPQNLGKIRPGPVGGRRAKGGTLRIQGHSTAINARYQPLFQGFLRALTRRGYRIHSLGGQNTRKIAGSSRWSLHAYGLAIDINPKQNPFTNGRKVTNLPRGVGKLAARYGLVWGGNWKGGTKDTMHFSIPFRGTK